MPIVDHGVDRQEIFELGSPPIAQHQRGGQREAAASRRPHEADIVDIHSQRCRVVKYPADAGVAIFRCGGVGVLRRLAIVDRSNRDAQLRGGDLQYLILTLEVTHDHAAAMDVNESGSRRGGVFRLIQPERQVTARPGIGVV